MLDPATAATLRAFRAAAYASLGTRRDALFDLLDTVTTVGLVPSLVHLSLAPVHRRGWGSLYAALAAGEMDAAALRALLRAHPLDDGEPIYALDTSVWPRNDAETSPERGHYFSPSRQSAGQPIVTGWSYAWLAQLNFTHDSWTAPRDVRRVPPCGDAHVVAAAQIREVVTQRPLGEPVPLFVFDAGYDPETLARALGELDGQQVAVLVRLRSGRCFYEDVPLRAPGERPVGRPRRHGRKFACDDERTWWAPDGEHAEQHAQFGAVRVRAWAGVHARTQNHPRRGANRTKPTLSGTLVLVEVERLPRRTHLPKRLWLWWRGPGQPDLAVLWRAYVHRFDLEHTYRFAKQTLNWVTPRVRTPEQADRWTWLVVLAYTQLRLARRAVEDCHLPWERGQRPARAALTPNRVRQAFPQVLLALGTPANAPKPWGPSPGRPLGRRSRAAPRCPALKKAA
jgi:hypothetical protein